MQDYLTDPTFEFRVKERRVFAFGGEGILKTNQNEEFPYVASKRNRQKAEGLK